MMRAGCEMRSACSFSGLDCASSWDWRGRLVLLDVLWQSVSPRCPQEVHCTDLTRPVAGGLSGPAASEGCVVCLPEGVQLLCLIDKAADACRYLQTYGEWNRAAWLAKVGDCQRSSTWGRHSSLDLLTHNLEAFLAAKLLCKYFLVTLLLFFMSINYIAPCWKRQFPLVAIMRKQLAPLPAGCEPRLTQRCCSPCPSSSRPARQPSEAQRVPQDRPVWSGFYVRAVRCLCVNWASFSGPFEFGRVC